MPAHSSTQNPSTPSSTAVQVAAQLGSTGNEQPPAKKNKLPPVELRDEELIIVQQWTDVYREQKGKKARQDLLSENILPLLRKVNSTMREADWKERKSVGTLSALQCP
jgi:hypothetical protein